MRRNLTVFGLILLVAAGISLPAASQDSSELTRSRNNKTKTESRSGSFWSTSSKLKERYFSFGASNTDRRRSPQQAQQPTKEKRGSKEIVGPTGRQISSSTGVEVPAVTSGTPVARSHSPVANKPNAQLTKQVAPPRSTAIRSRAEAAPPAASGHVAQEKSSRRHGRLTPQLDPQKFSEPQTAAKKNTTTPPAEQTEARASDRPEPVVAQDRSKIEKDKNRANQTASRPVIQTRDTTEEKPAARAPSDYRRTASPRQDRVSDLTQTESEPQVSRLESEPVGGEIGDSLLFSKSPRLSVETLGPRQVVIGKESTFKVRVENLGDADAESVIVRINTPLGAQIVAVQASRGQTDPLGVAKQKPLQWRLERLKAQSTEFLTLRIVPRKSDSFDLGVTWTLAPFASQVRIEVQEPKLSLTIEGPHEVQYGETKLYRLSIANPGTGAADNVQLKLMPLDGGDRPMAVRQIGRIEAGAEQVMEVELTARQAGYLNVEALVIADSDLKVAASQRVLVRRANLSVSASGPEMNYAGTVATYRFRLHNEGNSTAQNIRITALLPTGGEYLDSSDLGKRDPEGRSIVWNVPSLAAQNNQNFEVRVSLSHPGDNLFRVSLSADDDLTASSEVTTRVEALADLQLVINDPRGPVPVEEEMIYEVHISNRGTKAAQDVDVVAFFSEGVEPISVSGSQAQITTGQVIFEPILELASGGEVIYKIVARANRSGNHIFRAEVACKEAGVRLVAEESTRFYGSKTANTGRSEQASEAATDVPSYRQPQQ